MKAHLPLAIGIATLALLSGCTKERLEPMTAVPEVRATSSTVTKPSASMLKHAQDDRVITDAVVVDRWAAPVTSTTVRDITVATPSERNTGTAVSSHVHTITFLTPSERTTGTVVNSHVRDITFLEGDRSNSNGSGLTTTPGTTTGGSDRVCSYCWQTGLESLPAQVPVRLLESDDPPRPAPRVGTYLLLDKPVDLKPYIGVKGVQVGTTISDDGGMDE